MPVVTVAVPGRLVQRHEVIRLVRALATADQAGVADGAVQPGPERLGLADPRRVAIRLQQRLLHRVVGVIGPAADEQAEAVRDLLRPHQQRLHGVLAARLDRPHQPRVGLGVGDRSGLVSL